MQKRARFLELDGLRALAALAVILFHFTSKYHGEYGQTSPPFLFEYGHLGVDLFFIISGYVIFMTVEKTKSSISFLWLRFTRLFPTYWTAILFSFVMVSLFGLVGREVSWKAFLFNFTMIQELFQIPHVDGVYWSLLPELMFYLLMAVLMQFKGVKYIHTINVIWLGLIVFQSFYSFPEIVAKILNLKYGMLFIAGIEFYVIKHQSKSQSTLVNWLLIFGSWLTCLLVYDSIEHLVVVTSFYLIFILLQFNLLPFLRFKPLVFLGAISYPLYLIHQNFGYILMNTLALNFWIELGLAIGLSIGVATLIHYGIEKPSLSFLRRQFKR